MTEQPFAVETSAAALSDEAADTAASRNPFVAMGYRAWWLGGVVAGMGVGIQTTTVPLFIKDRVATDHRDLIIAVALICQQLPAALFALLGGVIADRVERRRILVRTYAVAATVSFTYVILSQTTSTIVWPVFILCAIVGSAGAFTNPARQSMMPQILTTAQLQNGVIFGTMAFMASLQFVGPSLGGVVADSLSLTVAFACEVAMLSCAAFLFSRIATDAPVPTGKNVFHDLREGIAYIRTEKSLLGVLLLGAVPGMFIIGPFAVTAVAMANDVLSESDKFVGFLWGSFGAGIVVGSVVLSLIRLPRRGYFLCLSVFIGGGLMAVYGASSTTAVSMAVLLIAGILGPAIFINYGVALIQENVTRQMMGRVMSMWGLTFTISGAIGYAQAGVLSNAFGPQPTVIIGGVIASGCGLLAMLFLRPVTRMV
jgi:MFS family permease